MKKMYLLLICLMGVFVSVHASDDKIITTDQLPNKAQQFLKKHFANKEIAVVKMDPAFFQKDYEVIFQNGERVELDGKGEWKEISCKQTGVPAVLVPQKIKQYLKQRFANEKILKIEKDKKEYEVELSNRVGITFNKRFQVIDIDHD